MTTTATTTTYITGKLRTILLLLLAATTIVTAFVTPLNHHLQFVHGLVHYHHHHHHQQQHLLLLQLRTNKPQSIADHFNRRSFVPLTRVQNQENASVNGEVVTGTSLGTQIPESTATATATTTTTTTTSASSGAIKVNSNNNNNNSKPFVKKKLQTFTRYLEIECWKRSELRGLESVLSSVANACKQITKIVQRAQTDDMYGVAINNVAAPYTTNIQGEVQQKLDVLCNTIMLQAFCGSGREICAVASEEEDHPRCCSDVMNDSAFAMGDFTAVFDPIDGSKNIDASLPVGTIFGIYKRPHTATTKNNIDYTQSVEPFLQDGHALVSAGYCLYSATTVLVLTLGSGVDGFTLDPDTGRFLHTHKDIRIPSSGPIYSFNEAHFHDYEEPVQKYLEALKRGSSSVGVRSNARYIGALVADVHNVLINGGIYGYPSTKTHRDGKLRLLYESAPMAMIMEQAGGAGSTGHGRLLDLKPSKIHQRVPTFLGSTENVFELDQFYRYYGDDNDNKTTL